MRAASEFGDLTLSGSACGREKVSISGFAFYYMFVTAGAETRRRVETSGTTHRRPVHALAELSPQAHACV